MVERHRIWMDGKMVPFEQATTHVLSHTLHYGLAVFEGIRCYAQTNGSNAIFRLDDHIRRLLDSAKLATIHCPYSAVELREAVLETLRSNQLGACYIRPLIWLGEGSIKIAALDNVVHTAIAAWPWGAYLGDDALEKGIRACVSSYRRLGIQAFYEKAKISGQYVNSVLAKREAQLNGYDEALLLDLSGFVAEGSGENVFIVTRDKLITPPRGASMLCGFTRDSVLELAKTLDMDVEESLFTRSDLYIADEVFLTGTAAELTPVREIDGRRIGSGTRGPVTERLQRAYFSLVRGENKLHEAWLTPV